MSDHTVSSSQSEINEEWKSVALNLRYEISSLGRIRRAIAGSNRPAGMIVKPRTGTKTRGYKYVRLANGDGTYSPYAVHRLVAIAFLGPRPIGFQINHKNGNKADCCRENLEYVTPQQNSQHAAGLGLYRSPKGVHNGNSKLTEADVRLIRQLRSQGELLRVIAAKVGISLPQVGQIANGRRWSWVK